MRTSFDDRRQVLSVGVSPFFLTVSALSMSFHRANSSFVPVPRRGCAEHSGSRDRPAALAGNPETRGRGSKEGGPNAEGLQRRGEQLLMCQTVTGLQLNNIISTPKDRIGDVRQVPTRKLPFIYGRGNIRSSVGGCRTYNKNHQRNNASLPRTCG